jgi:hypothetical protein
MIWRVVLSKIATLQEIETHWSLIDLLDANEVLDYRDYISEQESNKK